MTFKKYLCLAGMLFPLGLVAQEASDVTLCDFESADSYKSVGVYDTWAESPFRTGVLTGNAKVVNNHLNEVDALLGYAPNESSKILGVQRSRYGSNTFGALVELKEPFALTKKTQYVHVKINTPKESKVMLIGLGNRDDRPGQSALTEQFWSTSTSKVLTDHWSDAVFAISGANGITIRNLLVVVDCASTHNLSSDFAAYIDDIVLSTQSTPFFTSTLYPINYDEDQAHTRGTARYTASISLNSSDGSQTIEVNQAEVNKLYIKRMNDCFYAKAGEKVTSGFSGSMNWMAGYVYIDQDNNGKFDVKYTDDAVTDAKDLMSYSQYNGVDSEGNTVSGAPSLNPPSYVIPASITPGIYRMRYKVDWDCVDPGGNTSSGNPITGNGGVIVDTRINIHDTQVTVSRTTDELGGGGLNGDILLEDGTAINGNKVPFGQDLTVKVEPAPGFRLNYVVMRHGYNLEGDSLVNGNLQWKEEIIRARAFQNSTYTIPAASVDGNIRFIPYFSSTSGGDTEEGEEYALNFDESLPMSDATSNVLSSVKFTLNSGTSTTLKVGNSDATTVYRNLTPKEVAALKGSSVTTTINYKGQAVNAYLYLDMNRDGHFTTEINDDGSVTDNSELIAYSFYNNRNSKGETASAEGAGYSLPIFQVPADLPSGMYRARLKLDVNNIDPAGNWKEGVSGGINENGGYVVDFLMNIHGETAAIEVNSVNGSLVGRSNTGIPQTTAIRTAYAVLPIAPADGYVLDSLVIRHGYSLDGEQYPHGNRQWSEYKSTKGSAGKIFTIPKDTVNGDLRITAYFSPDGTEVYKLKFADEFNGEDGSLPNSKFWGSPTRYSSTWNRLHAQTEEGRAATAFIKDGKLVTRCIANTFTGEGDVSMISGAVQSSGKMNFTYGRVEGRLRTNPHSGNFPAFWMMPQDGSAGWPECGEIDIWEQINSEDKTYHTIHSKWGNTLGGGPTKSGNATCTNGDYHVFALEWTEDLLTWYANGKKVFSYAKSTTQSELDNGQWPFDAPFYLILNQSVGDGSWAAAADVTYQYETLFDWVRVYQKDGQQMTETGIDTAPSAAAFDFYLRPGYIRLVAPQATAVKIYDLQGRTVFSESVQGNKNVPLPKGVYVLNGKKVMVP